MDLKHIGWNEFFQKNYENMTEYNLYKDNGYKLGRVCTEQRGLYKIYTEDGETMGEVSGKLRFSALSREDYPAVGDWVVISRINNGESAIIHEVLPRKSKFSRKAAGLKTDEQILAANVDTVFLVNSLNGNFNPRRIERYLTLAWDSGADPVIVLSKSDLCDDIDEKVVQAEEAAPFVPVHVTSTETGFGMEELNQYFTEGKTVALLGSSGVGKSSIVNSIIGSEVQKVGDVRKKDDKGRHTSTYREMFVLPQGGLLIDTPGMRELQMWEGSEGLSDTFSDIEELASGCRYRDCRHENEPGCAVKKAIEEGLLSEERLESYKKLLKELKYFNRKQETLTRIMEKKKQKKNYKDRVLSSSYDNY